MKRTLATITAILALTALFATAAGGRQVPTAPATFFGIGPQQPLTTRDVEYMHAGGIGIVRTPVVWSLIQPTAKGPYEWGALDYQFATAARGGLQILPFIYGTPGWLHVKETSLPIDNARQRAAWKRFVRALAERYGPGGDFWTEHSKAVNYEPAVRPALPVRTWQVWNEANFFYFAYPASPQRYARLLKQTTPVIKSVTPGAKVILTGLFGDPDARAPKGVDAADFLRTLYRTPGIKRFFDGVSLHPYAVDAETLEELVEEVHEISDDNHDRVPLYITEMGWGSENNFQQVAFEQGIRGQVRQLRDSYTYLLENRRRLRLKQVYWFSWKDVTGYCNFCDSVGLFRGGTQFRPKPAWHAFLRFSGGRTRP